MENNNHSLTFDGSGADLFIIYLKNIFFTIITLGIYSFWARVNVTRFLYNHTRYLDEPFDYHATGMERFIGFLKALGIMFLFAVVIGIVSFVSELTLGKEAGNIVVTAFIYLVVLAVLPFVVVGRERFRQSRSSLKSVRFRFNGAPRELVIVFLKGLGLSIVTLGIYAPWFYCSMRRFFLNHSNYGNQAFDFTGTGDKLVKPYFLGLFLTIVTLGIYGFWWKALITRFQWDNTYLQGKRFSSTITGGQLFKTTLLSVLLVIATLGIGIPWAVLMIMRLNIGTICLEDGIDFAAIKTDYDARASALSDGLAEAADALDSVGSMFS